MGRVTFHMVFPSRRVRIVGDVLNWIAGLNFVCVWLTIVAAPIWGPREPTPEASYPAVFRGQTHYLPDWLGLYLNIGFWAQFGLLAACVAVPLLLGARLQRRPQALQ